VLSRKQSVRLLFGAVIVLSFLPVSHAYLGAADSSDIESQQGETVADERASATVIVADSHGGGTISVIDSNGTLTYFDDAHDAYHDVDQVGGREMTVEYLAHDVIPGRECGDRGSGGHGCIVTVIERLDIRTGEVTELRRRVRPDRGSTAAHDFDRVDEEHVLIAEIGEPDRVSLVNTETGISNWTWDVQAEYPISSGGIYPGDWTHLNDVEVVAEGRYMVSLRNQDQVVFVNRTTGLDESWTLGEDDEHDTLYEQHNPDYIDERHGGPAVVVADSENGRAVEYQRADGSWERSWSWTDDRLQWPRDVDRLPNGNTLITDTNGGRIIEVDREGKIVWSVDYPGPYESERLDTPSESGGGESAASLGMRASGTASGAESEAETGPARAIVGLFPSLLINGALYVLPVWFSPIAVVGLFSAFGAAVAWGLFELHQSPYRLEITRHD
jgi:hypothetical protein